MGPEIAAAERRLWVSGNNRADAIITGADGARHSLRRWEGEGE